MKKFFLISVMFALIFSCIANRTFAADYYLGEYSSGLKAYVITETLKFESMRTFQATVKAVNTSGKLVEYITYYFDGAPGSPETYSNSQGYSGLVSEGNISNKLFNYAMEVWRDRVINGH